MDTTITYVASTWAPLLAVLGSDGGSERKHAQQNLGSYQEDDWRGWDAGDGRTTIVQLRLEGQQQRKRERNEGGATGWQVATMAVV
ncbi:unnamed protein product [Camellia sinensis]